MKYSFSFLFLGLFFSVFSNSEKNLVVVKKAIVHHDLLKLENLLEKGQQASVVINDVQEKRDELIKLAEGTEAIRNAKNQLGEKKYTQWKRIGVGAVLTGYAAVKLILGSVYQTSEDELDTSEEQGFFMYERLTDASIGLAGLSWIYWGVTGKNPNQKLQNAVEIAKLLKKTIPMVPMEDI